MGKQMEGDNQRRRALARRARQSGRRASEADATLGASKQPSHQPDKRRSGPRPAGAHKPVPGRPMEPSAGRPASPTPVTTRPARPPGSRVETIGYRTLVDEISRRTGVEFTDARSVAEATVAVLARALAEGDRERLLDALPAELSEDIRIETVDRQRDVAGFVAEVARLSRRTTERARYQAQATLTALADAHAGLLDSIDLPVALRELVGPLPTGGDLVGPSSGTAELAAEDLATALARLPYWSVEDGVLCRTIELPPANLDRVLDRLSRLKPELGRGPSIGRPTPDTAVLTVRTGRAEGVTGLDVDLAHRVDDAVEDAGAGLS
ncbi:DUF2267 domain-containing protein [Plantactinospora sp. GCM10030261]|uniref:DUF2267 domain-containing protein n=1 Tax=Plantactinospora sp. GCM10030261 TaxID=3273420 RepID=UPI003606F702